MEDRGERLNVASGSVVILWKGGKTNQGEENIWKEQW